MRIHARIVCAIRQHCSVSSRLNLSYSRNFRPAAVIAGMPAYLEARQERKVALRNRLSNIKTCGHSVASWYGACMRKVQRLWQ